MRLHPLHPGNHLLDFAAGAAPSTTAVVRVGLLGCGVVGAPVARILLESAESISLAAGTKIELARVAVRHVGKPRPVSLPPEILTADAASVVEDPAIDVVVEVIGGVDLPRRLILQAFDNGKSVVTANKELLAVHGGDLAGAAADASADLFFEASVGGAIPVVRALREALVADRVSKVAGIINGTTNFILDRVARTRCSFADALAHAQALGYAESDPAADVEGSDSAAKIAILASLAFRGWITQARVQTRGISGLDAADVLCAQELGFAVRLIAVAERRQGKPWLSVRPVAVPRESPLGRVHDVLNAVQIDCLNAGKLVFEGKGAGGVPSASAVVGDVVAAARNLVGGVRSPLPLTRWSSQGTTRVVEESARYVVRVAEASETDVRRVEHELASSFQHVSPIVAEGSRHLAFVTQTLTPLEMTRLTQGLAASGYAVSLLPIVEVE